MFPIPLKTNEEEDPKRMASCVHQAHVRRDVVVGLIEGAQSRGHRSYRHVNMDDVRKKAERLPENGVPPEIVRLLPNDAGLNTIMIPEAAAPALRAQQAELGKQAGVTVACATEAPPGIMERICTMHARRLKKCRTPTN